MKRTTKGARRKKSARRPPDGQIPGCIATVRTQIDTRPNRGPSLYILMERIGPADAEKLARHLRDFARWGRRQLEKPPRL